MAYSTGVSNMIQYVQTDLMFSHFYLALATFEKDEMHLLYQC